MIRFLCREDCDLKGRSFQARLDILVTPPDFAAERHGNDHSDDDDHSGSNADTDDSDFVLVQHRVDFLHNLLGTIAFVPFRASCALSAISGHRCVSSGRGWTGG